MSELLGDFNEEEFTVLKPKQVSPPTPPPKGKGKPPENPEPPEDKPKDKNDDENIEELPVKDREDIIKDLENAGIGNTDDENTDENTDEQTDNPYEIGDKNKNKPEEGGDKPEKGEGKPEDGGDKPKKDEGKPEEGGDKPEDGGYKPKGKGKKGKLSDEEQEANDKERRERIKAKNYAVLKRKEYIEIVAKHQDKLPKKVRGSLEKAITDLEKIIEKTN